LKAKLDESARCNESQKKELEALQEQLEVKDLVAEELCHEVKASNCTKDKEVSQLTTQLETMSNNVCDLQAKLDESKMSLEASQEQVKAGDAFMEVNSLEAAVISWLWDLSPRNCTGTIHLLLSWSPDIQPQVGLRHRAD
jgi:hypothetical protein